MHSRQGENSFNVQIERIYMVTGRYSEEDLAEFLGILANEIATAKDRGYVPAEWLIMLLRAKGINPEWILTGNARGVFSLPSLLATMKLRMTYGSAKPTGKHYAAFHPKLWLKNLYGVPPS